MTKKKEDKKTTIKRADLEATLKDMMEVMDYEITEDSPLGQNKGDMVECTPEELIEQIKMDAEIAQESDKFSPITLKIFAKLGIKTVVEEDSDGENTENTENTEEDEAPVKEEKPVKEKKEKTKTKKEATNDKVKKEKPVKKSYSRSNALLDALKTGGTREEIVNKSNELFIKNGGTDKLSVAYNMFSYVVPSLLQLGVITKSEKSYSWTGLVD